MDCAIQMHFHEHCRLIQKVLRTSCQNASNNDIIILDNVISSTVDYLIGTLAVLDEKS